MAVMTRDQEVVEVVSGRIRDRSSDAQIAVRRGVQLSEVFADCVRRSPGHTHRSLVPVLSTLCRNIAYG